MGRKIASGLELSFHKHSKRWYKTIAGKPKYFGSGKYPSDQASYRAALKKYRAYLEEEEARAQQAQEEQALRGKARAYYIGKVNALRAMGFSDVLPPNEAETNEALTIAEWLSGQDDDEAEEFDPTNPRDPMYGDPADRMAARHEREKLVDAIQNHAQAEYRKQHPTIAGLCEAWLEAEQLRHEAGEFTLVGYKSKAGGIKTLSEWAEKRSFGDAQNVECILADYRQFLLSKLNDGSYSANTVNDKIKFTRQFIKWCYSRRRIDELPRNLADFTKKVAVQKGGEPLSKEQIHVLWDHADDLVRAWIALGLNCGFKNMDIATLKAESIRDGRLLGYRSKSGVPMNYKLWPVTQELIEKTRMDRKQETRGLLWVTAGGSQLVTTNGGDTVGRFFTKLRESAGIQCTFQQLRDTGAQEISNAMRASGEYNPALVQLYLAHKDASTAAFYLSNNPEDMQTQALDEATDQLAEQLSLAMYPA